MVFLTLDSDIAMTDDEAVGFVDGVAINKILELMVKVILLVQKI